MIMSSQIFYKVVRYVSKSNKFMLCGRWLGNKIYFDTELTLQYRDLSDFSKSLFED